jgi:hypothetical protein
MMVAQATVDVRAVAQKQASVLTLQAPRPQPALAAATGPSIDVRLGERRFISTPASTNNEAVALTRAPIFANRSAPQNLLRILLSQQTIIGCC